MKQICNQGFKVSNQDRKALDHYLDIEPKEWSQNALNGMINKSVKTILKDWLNKFKAQAETVPANLSQLLPAIVNMEGFKPYNREWGDLIKAKRKQAKDTEIWSGGFQIEEWQEIALNAYYTDYEQDLYNLMENKIACRKNAFEKEHEAKLLADPEVSELPKDQDDLIDLITSKPHYKNRKQRELEEIN